MGKSGTAVLSDLISLFGVSGSEGAVRKYIQAQIKPYVDSMKVDRMGNLIARKKGKGPKVMLSAHMDEIGLMIKRVSDKGLVHFTELGGVDPITILGNSVHIKTKKGAVHGFITTHEMAAGKYIEKLPQIEEFFVDTGKSGKELKKLGVEVGSYIHLETNKCCIVKDGIIKGKALDNRLGCYVLIELIKKHRRYHADTYFVFTVQEEFGLYGAKTSAFELEPDWGIVVDTTQGNDLYPEPSRYLGKGPCITVKDGEFISNPCITGWLKSVARKKKIPHQMEAAEEGTTDAAIIQTSRGGVPTGVLSIPVRNIHTSSGIAMLKDVQESIHLLEELMKKPPKKCIM